MLDRLKAEDALSHISQTAAGVGTMSANDRHQYHMQLRFRAEIGPQRGARLTAEQLQAAGVNVVIEDAEEVG